MENYTEIKNKLDLIIEQSNCDKPACKNCKSGRDCGHACVFGLNEGRKNLTTPNYSCGNFAPVYSLTEETLDNLRDLKGDIERINESLKNLDLFLSGKISESDFNEIVR